MDAPNPPSWSSAMNDTRTTRADRPAANASSSRHCDSQSTSDFVHRSIHCTTTGPHIALLHPEPGIQHESTLREAKTIDIAVNTPSQKSRKRSRSSQHKFPETRTKVEDSPEDSSPGPDIYDPGYAIAASERDSRYEVAPDSDRHGGCLAKRAKLMPLGLAQTVTSHVNLNINGSLLQIRSCAQLVAQDSQPQGLGLSPTLVELRGRDDSDLPADIKRWVHLSTITGVYGDHQRLPPHFSRTAPHLFTLHAHQNSAHTGHVIAPFTPLTLYSPELFTSSFPLNPDAKLKRNVGAVGPTRFKNSRYPESEDDTSEPRAADANSQKDSVCLSNE